MDPSSSSSPIYVVLVPPALEYSFNIALATAYLSLLAFIVVVYDHVLAYQDERRSVWSQPKSVVQGIFMINRYVVVLGLGMTFVLLSGFAGWKMSDETCFVSLVVIGSFQILSLAASNGIMTMHVIRLWDSRPIIKHLAWAWYVAVYTASLGVFIAGGPPQARLTYNAFVRVCILTKLPPLEATVWALPLGYEAVLLFAVIWNAVDRPRTATFGMVKALHRDGILFLVVMTLCRILQLSLTVTKKPELFLISNSLVWAIITITLNRSIMSMHRVAKRETVNDLTPGKRFPGPLEPPSGVTSPTLNTLELTPRHPDRFSDGYKSDGGMVHIETTIESFTRV